MVLFFMQLRESNAESKLHFIAPKKKLELLIQLFNALYSG
jgi:hypothetical protein